jgi:hypothetical protein
MARKTNGGSLFHFSGFFHIVVSVSEMADRCAFPVHMCISDCFSAQARLPFEARRECAFLKSTPPEHDIIVNSRSANEHIGEELAWIK